MSTHYDVIIIGSGAGGGTLFHALAPTGKRILLLERGGYVPREKANWCTRAVNLEGRYNTKEVWRDRDGGELHPHTNYYVGGNTKFYGAALFRLRREDFGEVKHHGGISPAWPIIYEDLEPYYTQAEALYHVHGVRGEDPTDPPGSAPYPHPPVSHEPRIQALADDMARLGLRPFHVPLGVMLDERDPHKSRCIRCETCDGHPCLVAAKSDAQVLCVDPTLARYSNTSLLTGVLVTRVVVWLAGMAHAEPTIKAVGLIGMTVADLERSIAFYAGVLGFEKVSDLEVWGGDYERLQGVFGLRMRVVRMRLGDESIELTEYLTPRGRPVPADSRGNDHWFQHIAIIVSDMDRAYAWVRQHRVQHASPAPQRLPDWNPNAAGIRAFSFKDPDGHFLEILWFPPDKGDARWHHPTNQLFLGIDHTAIVVAETDRSLSCYRDTLGLRVVGESENHGPEQERLNSVFGARLRITTLRAAAGPGIELLEYLSPRDGRPAPSDARANDLAHWQTALVAADAEAVYRPLRESACTLLSPGVVASGDRALGFRKAFLIRDPDGHALEVIEP